MTLGIRIIVSYVDLIVITYKIYALPRLRHVYTLPLTLLIIVKRVGWLDQANGVHDLQESKALLQTC